jgi:beta-mannosidase
MKLLLCSLLLSLTALQSYAQLTLDWEMYHPVQKTWLPFGQAGTVQEFLWHKGELPDPFFGENEALYQWVEEEKWHFRTKFFLQESFFNAAYLILDIPNLDTYAQIYLNGTLLTKTANFFIHYRIPIAVKELLCGYNTIEIEIEPPISYHAQSAQYKSFTYPSPNDAGTVKVASLSRKPQYHFGWDWAPRIATMGFAYPITIAVQPQLRIDYLLVNTLEIKENEAKLELKGGLIGEGKAFHCSSTYFKDFNIAQQEDFKLEQNLTNVQLWWPVGQGAQYLYKDTLRFYDARGMLLLEHPFTFGIRKAELIQAQDEWGTSFAFQINGRQIFAKGANVIPPGIFAGPALDSAYVALVPQMQAANFNLVRIWGGGMYAPDAFMQACDRAGIMVWHDFMFACAMYPGDTTFLDLVTKEIKQQIPRLAAHPSLVYFNGNNEVDVAWKNWGFQLQYQLDESAQQTIEKAYKTVFLEVLPAQVQAFTNLPYIHTSPLSNWGNDAYFNHGTMHYWGVWHGKDPLTDFASKIGRFNAEYGFQSFPEPSTIDRFALPADQHLHSAVMKTHQKSYVGNGMIEKHAKTYYGKAKDFETFVYYSQLTQRKAVSMAIAGHRADAPRCMGTVYWQLNDCWPAPTWSSIDYFGNWKALHYAAQDDYRSIAVLEKYQDELRFLVLCSEVPEDTLVTVEVQFYDAKGVFQRKERKSYPVRAYQTQVLMGITEAYTGFVKVVIDERYERLFTFIPKRKAPEVQVNLTIELLDPILKKAVVHVETPQPLIDFWIYSKNQELHFEHNFETLLPGKHTLEFTYQDHLPSLGEFSYLLR